MPYATALVLHPDCARHDTGWRHAEHQGRLPAIVQAVYEDTPALLPHLLQREGVPARVEDLARVHTSRHIARIRAAAAEAARGRPVYLDADTVVSSESWLAALAAAGCAISAARLVIEEEAATAFALCRPPGHHAMPDQAAGFCLINNVAVAARWVQAQRPGARVLIVDWDVHHGNGTQAAFYADPTTYLLSLHLAEHYPGTGHREEIGSGEGLGTTRNLPFTRAVTAVAYLDAAREALDAAFAAFPPDLVLCSAGFDCLAGDPLGGLPLEPADLHTLAGAVLTRARAAGAGVVAVLEGGYVPARLGAGVVNVLRAFAGLPAKP
jgi:acetoin utilization deacetylase AcuC-like enzyme